MEIAIFRSAFTNSVKKNNDNIASIFRNKINKYVTPRFDSLCECHIMKKDIYFHCSTSIYIPKLEICNAFIKYVKEDNIPQIKFILNIYGCYMHKVDDYMPKSIWRKFNF